MSFVFTKNIPITNGGSTWWYLKELLKTAGWVVKSSGDGLAAFSSSGDILSQANTGANGMDNTNAWFRIQQPSLSKPFGPIQPINREFTFQRNASTSQATIKYSFSANFSGGSPSATVTPTATDQQNACSNQAIWGSSFHLQVGAQNSDGYGFWMAPIVYGNPNTTNSGGVVFDPMMAGTYSTNEIDPYIIYTETTSSGSFNASKLNSQAGGSAWFGKGTTGETYGTVAGCAWSNAGGNFWAPNGVGTSPYTFKEQILPIIWAKNFTNNGLVAIKGAGTIMRWTGTIKQSGMLMSTVSSGDRICIVDVNFPWDGTAVLI